MPNLPSSLLRDQIMMSQPEIMSLACRAARGAGYSWGMAEEAGFAAVWLAHYGFDWADTLLARLSGPRGSAFVPQSKAWRSAGPVCGLHAGVTLADFATLPEGPLGSGVTIGAALDPLCLLPFVARSAARAKVPLNVCCDRHVWVRLGPTGVHLSDLNLNTRSSAMISVRPAPANKPDTPPREHHQTAHVSKRVYDRLETLALHMTVPATAQSLSGAGAAGSDSD
jgi:hypothetical protein